MMVVKQSGLTLIELMVVVAVMAVVAAVAYPLYTSQSQKARRADAKVALETLALAQERAYTLGGQYYSLAAGTLQVQLPTAIASGDSNEGHYSITVSQNTNQDFTATATPKSGGAQAGDSSKCSTFTIDQLGTKGHTGSATNCW